MIKCSKCNNIPDENDVIGWKCNSCGKAFKVSKSKLHNILAKKAEIRKSLIFIVQSAKVVWMMVMSVSSGNVLVALQIWVN